MISIEYTNEFLEGEPGPNFYWCGIPSDFVRLVTDLHHLGVENGNELNLSALNYVQVAKNYKIILKSSEGGRTLCMKNESNVVMELDKDVWRRVFDMLLSVSYEKSHNYIEFDDLNLEESANVIVSSEA